eukprot:g33451.t1
MVDYSKFSKIEDSDEEPLWTEARDPQQISKKVLCELDAAADALRSRSRSCHCFLDFSVDIERLKSYTQELSLFTK